MSNKTMPFDFLLDYLPAGVVVKPPIGMFYIYYDGKIVLIARKTGKNARYNGVWISTAKIHHSALIEEIPAVANFVLDDGVETNWLLLSSEHDDFEEAAINICELISKKDKRIGKVTPASRALFDL